MRFLFCTLASHGYIYPAIHIARSLIDLGHDVAMLTGPGFDHELVEADCPRVELGEEPDPIAFRVRTWGSLIPNLRQIKLTEQAVSVFQPDAIVTSSMTIGATLSAKWQGLPVAVVGLGTYMWSTVDNTPPLDDIPDESYLGGGMRYYAAVQIVNQIATQLGRPPFEGEYASFPLLGDLFLLRSVRELQQNIDRLPQKVTLVGDCIWYPEVSAETHPALTQALDTDLPIYFVQHDNRWSRSFRQNGQLVEGIPDFWDTLVTVLGDQPARVIVSTNDRKLVEQPSPANFYVGQHIPHQLVFPHADYVIATGTSSMMLGALRHGLPMLQIVTASENFLVEEVSQAAGVAVCLNVEDVTSASLQEQLDHLHSNKQLKRNASNVAVALEQARQSNVAATAILDCVVKNLSTQIETT